MTILRTGACLLAALLLASCGPYDVATVEEIPEPVRRSVRTAVDGGHRAGVVVGLINPVGRHYFAYGALAAGGGPVTPASQFGVGSLTKLFTAELLADQVARGELALDDRLIGIWPDVDDHADTRLWQLASHRAGLPRDIPTAALGDAAPESLLGLLASERTLPAEPHYSNAGMALLGLALERSAGEPLASQLEQRVSGPMGLAATGYQPDPDRLAHPHRGGVDITSGRPATPAIAHGAGGLHSSAEDLLEFVARHLSPTTAHETARRDLLTGRAGTLPGGVDALGWKLHRDGELRVFHHGGDGNGYQAFVAFRPDNGVGVVLLTNTSADDDLQQVALHLLDPRIDLPAFDHPPTVPLDAGLLQRYAGQYRFDEADGNRVELQVDDGRLIFDERTANGEPVRRSPMYARSDTEMFLRDVPVVFEFPDGDGPVQRIVIRVADSEYAMVRDDAPPSHGD